MHFAIVTLVFYLPVSNQFRCIGCDAERSRVRVAFSVCAAAVRPRDGRPLQIARRRGRDAEIHKRLLSVCDGEPGAKHTAAPHRHCVRARAARRNVTGSLSIVLLGRDVTY